VAGDQDNLQRGRSQVELAIYHNQSYLDSIEC
jgi:hypothetical protein